MKRSIAIVTAVMVVGHVSAALALEGYRTAQNQLIVAGLKPGKLYGVIATTNKNGVGVRNFTANACGEVIIGQAAGFRSLTIDRKQLLVKDLAIKKSTPCTKVLSAVAKPAQSQQPPR